MTILEVLRQAANETEIYFLLTSYVEAVRYCDKFHTLPAQMRDLPLVGADDLKRRVERLRAGLDRSDMLDRPIIREASEIFAAAVDRMTALERAASPRALEAA